MGFVYVPWLLAYGLILTSIPSRSRGHIYVAVPNFSIPMAAHGLSSGKSRRDPSYVAKPNETLCYVTVRA